jgi:hypothetical protein
MTINIILLDANKNDFDAILAYGTIALAVGSFFAVFVQIHWNRRFLRDSNNNSRTQLELLNTQLKSENENSFKYTSVKLAQDFDAQFQALAEEREEVADIIISNNILASESLDYSLLTKKVDNIYDLFDTIGYFVKHQYIKDAVVHQYFDYWFSEYYTFYSFYGIKKLSGYPDTVWNNLASLYKAMDIVETGENYTARVPIDKKELDRFFREERADDPPTQQILDQEV